jgi:hypothetical protein
MHPSFPDSNAFEYETFSESADFLRSDLFMDPEEEGDDLRSELLELNHALSSISARLDYSAIIAPFLVQLDAPPTQILLARMRRQVERMQQALARHRQPTPVSSVAAPPVSSVAAPPVSSVAAFAQIQGTPQQEMLQRRMREDAAPHQQAQPVSSLNIGVVGRPPPDSIAAGARPLIPRRRRDASPEIVPQEIEPSWGPCKRYEAGMSQDKYNEVLQIARWIFDTMRNTPGGARACTQQVLKQRPDLPCDWNKILGYLTAYYLHYADLKNAASENDFSAVKIAYFRCEALRRQRAEKHPGRVAFMQWATQQIRENPQITSQKKLLAHWCSMPETTRKPICACDPKPFFQSSKFPTPLSFAELAHQARGNDAHQARGHDDDDSLSGDGLSEDMPPNGSEWADVPDPPPPAPAPLAAAAAGALAAAGGGVSEAPPPPPAARGCFWEGRRRCSCPAAAGACCWFRMARPRCRCRRSSSCRVFPRSSGSGSRRTPGRRRRRRRRLTAASSRRSKSGGGSGS